VARRQGHCCAAAQLVFRPPGPLSPTLDAVVDFVPGHTVSHEPHGDAQSLHVLVSALVVEEKHFVVLDTAVSVYACEMRRLGAGIYLQMVEVVYGAT
jgi:hypothetical protein